MISTLDIETWLRANGLPADVLVTHDGFIPPMPDRIVCLTGTGGPSPSHERAFDHPGVQVITRDGQRSPGSSDTLASLVYDIFMGATRTTIGSTYVASIDGTPPAFLDNEEGRRFSHVATYTLMVARSVH